MSTESSGAPTSGAPANTAEARPPVELSYPRFLAEALAVLAALVVVGYLATVNLGGREAVPAMLAGCALALAASLAGTVPIVIARGRRPERLIPAYLGALALRLTVAIFLALAAALSGLFAPAPLLIWMFLAHFGLLVADTRFALSLCRRNAGPRSAGPPNTGPRKAVPLEPVLEKR